jgi:hypothetical protein
VQPADHEDGVTATDLEQAAVAGGLLHTSAALARWRGQPAGVVLPWAAVSLTVGVLLLVATWLVALARPASTGDLTYAATFSASPTMDAAAAILLRNLLVLALHAMVCVGGYLAMTAVPSVAGGYRGVLGSLHRAATPVALAFFTLATAGSLTLQALVLGREASSIAVGYHLGAGALIARLAPHALPELTALFLPFGAWVVLARRRAWSDMVAASLLSVAFAVPVLAIAALIEVYVTPHLLPMV